MKNIYNVWPDAMNVCKWQYNEFIKSDCDLSDKPHSEIPTTLDNDLFKAYVEADLCQSSKDLATKKIKNKDTMHYVQLYTNTSSKFERKSKERTSVLHELSVENQAQCSAIGILHQSADQ